MQKLPMAVKLAALIKENKRLKQELAHTKYLLTMCANGRKSNQLDNYRSNN